MNRSLWLFNLFLAVIAAVIAGAIVDSFTKHVSSRDILQTPTSTARAAAQVDGTDAPASPARQAVPPQSEFAVLTQKDVFKLALPEAPAAPATRKPLPPPPPLPTLIGTVFVGDERKALLQEGKRIETFAVGENVAGGRLIQIDTDRVVIQRGDTPAEVWLKTSIQPVAAPGAPAPATAPTDEPAPGRGAMPAARPEVATPPVLPAPAEAPTAVQPQPMEQLTPSQLEQMTPSQLEELIRTQALQLQSAAPASQPQDGNPTFMKRKRRR